MKFTTKLSIFLILLTLVLGAGVYQAFELQKDQAIETSETQVNDTAGIVVTEIDDEMRNARGSLSSTALQTDSLRGLNVQRVLTGPEVIGVHVVSANGTVVLARGETSLVSNATMAANLSGEEYVTEALTSKTYISEAVWLPSEGKYATIISAPIVINGSVQGVVAKTRYLGLRGSTPRDELSVYVDGTARSAPPPNRTIGGIPDSIQRTATVETTGWEITVRKDTTALQNRLQTLAGLQVGGLVAVLLIVGGFGIWEYRIVLRQMNQLEEGFQALRDGDYDFSLSLSGSDEWQRITEGYDHVTSELAARERAIREREERLAVLNRALRHNLRNDMTTVIGRFEQLKLVGEKPDVEDIALKGKNEAEDVTELGEKARAIESVLDSAQKGLAVHDLAELMRQIVDEARTQYPDVDLEVDSPETATVRAVPHLYPGLVELVENACEHNDSTNPAVTVSIEQDQPTAGRTTLAVSDNGPGISNYEQEVVGAGEETDLKHGSGLGLWLVNWTAEKSDAQVEIQDRDEGGTCVRMVFDRAQSEFDEQGEDTATPEALPDGHN